MCACVHTQVGEESHYGLCPEFHSMVGEGELRGVGGHKGDKFGGTRRELPGLKYSGSKD